MTGVVLDASALLALLLDEPGADRVAAVLNGASMSSVNLSEVVAHYAKAGADEAGTRSLLAPLPLEIVPADEALAYDAGLLTQIGLKAGLSMGDRMCIALARARRARVLTADRAWQTVAGDLDAEVELIR